MPCQESERVRCTYVLTSVSFPLGPNDVNQTAKIIIMPFHGSQAGVMIALILAGAFLKLPIFAMRSGGN